VPPVGCNAPVVAIAIFTLYLLATLARPIHIHKSRSFLSGVVVMSQRTADLLISILASVVSLLLSWPYWRDFEYWPESPLAWTLYFAVGFVLAVYVFQVFIGSLREMFEHEASGHEFDEEA